MVVDTQVVDAEQLIVKHLDLWTSAQTAKSTAGRGSNNKIELTGIKKLRELILELAVRGKLVPQDPNDEPASELLRRIEADRYELVKAGKLKKQKPLPAITNEDKPFELPEKWEFKRLGDIADVFSGNSFDSQDFKTDTGLRVVKISNVGVGELIETDDYLPIEFMDKFQNFEVKEGDLVMALTRPYIAAGLKVALCSSTYHRALLNQRVAAIRTNLNSIFLYNFMQSTLVLGRYQERFGNSGLQPNLKVSDVTDLIVPVPPKFEQERIVNKVTELMALCDCLEQQSYQSIDAHNQLVDTLLQTLVDSANADELASNWQRLSEHFDTLFTTEYSIDASKKTILQLAVMGKLVKQDPTDEPASELLKRIAKEKEALVKAGKIKKQKPLPPITDDEKPFELPDGWSYATLQQLVTVLGDGLHGTPVYDSLGGYYFVNGNNLKDGSVIIKSETKKVNEVEYQKFKKELNERTVFVSINGTLGNVAFYNNEPIVLGKSACYFNLVSNFSKNFIKLIIQTPYFSAYASTKATGSTIRNLGLAAMNCLPIPVPPLSEQDRIVAKVDKLTKIFDSISCKLKESKQTQTAFSEAFVEQVV